MTVRILIVEDDAAIGELIEFTLTQADFEASRVESAERGLIAVREAVPALLLVDWMLPGMSGLALIQKLRQETRTAQLPIIMVSARGDESQRVAALDSGADDYLTKPFSPRELVARIRSLLRRRAPETSDAVITIGPLRLDPTVHAVTLHGVRLELRLIEFKLLRLLMTHPNQVFNRTQLLDRIWGDHVFIEERTVDVHVRRLRLALGEAGRTLITTVRGGGYKMIAPRSAPIAEDEVSS